MLFSKSGLWKQGPLFCEQIIGGGDGLRDPEVAATVAR